MCNFTHPKSLEELSMMRHWIIEAGLPHLIWVVVYGTAALFSYYRYRQISSVFPMSYLMGCLSMVFVFFMECFLLESVSEAAFWSRFFQQALLFLVYQARVWYVVLCGEEEKTQRVLMGGAGIYLLACLLLVFGPLGNVLSFLSVLLLHIQLVLQWRERLGALYRVRDSATSMVVGMVDTEGAVSSVAEEPAEPLTFRFPPDDFEAGTIPGKLLRLLRDRKLYLKPNLTIDEVALEVGTNRAYLSKCVNIELQVNFRELVNAFRIREAMQLFEEDPHIPLARLCQQCGFKNYSSFTFAFKLNTGQSPSEWCREVKQRKRHEKV